MITSRVWAGLLLLGLLLSSPVLGKERKPAPKADEDYDKQIKYADLPAPVKKTADKERGRHDIKSFWHVLRDGKEFYRIVIDTKGDDTVVRIKPGGDVLTEEETRDVHKTVVVVKKDVKLATGESDGLVVDFNRLPGPVKTEIGALAKSDRVHEVVRYQHRGRVMYRAQVGEGPYVRYVRVTEGGMVTGIRGDVDPGVAVAFDRTPGAVKSKIGAFARSGKVEEVYEYERGGKKYYQAQIEDRDGKHRFVTVDGGGKELPGLPQ